MSSKSGNRTPSASPQKDGGGGGLQGLDSTRVIKCTNCEEDTAIGEATMWGKTSWSCKQCKTNYNRQCERNKQNSVMKQWWSGLSGGERSDWYKSQKKLNPQKWQKKMYSTDKLLAESFDENAQWDGSVDDYIPCSEWVREELSMGFSKAQALKSWADALQNPDVLKRNHEKYGRLCHKFRAVRVETGQKKGFRSGIQREKDITDTADNAEAADMKADFDAVGKKWLDSQNPSVNSTGGNMGPQFPGRRFHP